MYALSVLLNEILLKGMLKGYQIKPEDLLYNYIAELLKLLLGRMLAAGVQND